MRKISKAGLSLIKNSEGCRLYAYKPVPTEKWWTIGWGHYGPDVKQGMTITQEQADAMLAEDMGKYEAYVNNPAYVPVTDQLTQNQFDALTSFCYNCGAGNLKALCKGRTVAQIAASITKYDKAGGKVLAGLTRRRQAELDLFNTPSDSTEDKKEDKPVSQERDINVPSKWAATAWAEVTANGYFDGTHPEAQITREESAIVINRLRKNFLALIAGVNGNVTDLDERLKQIESEG
ncbi:lysozyme [Paenibacillus polymyxa]|nr:lysozyme [Paenibacillus polymyxa]QPK56007.1 lysozyme [Paenibacillus polymyxa]QPK61087.1 lysozyme [Paenibacillus polymyxa]UOD88760.1 lysozyme [Paenibacillus polymyxa ATCC 842]WEK67843.1 lysozyme [Paenibacillus polymyxa]